MGNPFNVPVYIGDRGYYKMNEERSGFVAVSDGSPIGPMEGIFVYTETADDTVTFSTIPTATRGEQLSVNISKVTRAGYNTTFDRAILRFDEGHRMPKFQLNEESAKIYIPQNGMDYAIITVEEQGEIPINFSADENGTYTLSFSIDNMEFSYLHLIDNKTGNDIDLLVPELSEGPVTYTFNATTTDYESRFKLVYATGNSIPGDSFTFINSNGSFSIFGVDGDGACIMAVESQVVAELRRIDGRDDDRRRPRHLARSQAFPPCFAGTDEKDLGVRVHLLRRRGTYFDSRLIFPFPLHPLSVTIRTS